MFMQFGSREHIILCGFFLSWSFGFNTLIENKTVVLC